MRTIVYTRGVPRWATRLRHLAAQLWCRRQGHQTTGYFTDDGTNQISVCTRCRMVLLEIQEL